MSEQWIPEDHGMTTAPNGWPDASKPGVPLNPERDGTMHWMRATDGDGESADVAMLWETDAWYAPGIPEELSPADMGRLARYLGPCLTPAEVAAREQAAAVAMRDALVKMAQERATYERPDPSYAVKDPGHFNECCAAADALDSLVERMRAAPTPTDALAAALAQAKREGMEQAARIADSRRARHEAAARSPEADTDASASLFDAACEAGDIAAAIRAKAQEAGDE